MWNHLRSGIVGGIVAGAVILAGSAVAGSGIGGVFNLGQSNTVNHESLLAGSTAGTQLDVANVNTGSTAKALGLLGKSATAPTASVANTGGGPALGLLVNSGKTPFTVSSSTKVANLNADQLDGLDQSSFLRTTGKAADANLLDGIDSSGLIKGTGKTYTLAVAIPRHTDGTFVTYTPSPAVVPGLVNISNRCPPGNAPPSGGAIILTKLNDQPLNVFLRGNESAGAIYFQVVGAPIEVSTDPNGDLVTMTIQGGSLGAPPTITTIQVSTAVREQDCHFQIQALITNP